MRIGIDNISPGESTSRQAPGGMRMYLQSLLTEFALQAPQHHFVLFTPSWADLLSDSSPSNVEVVKLPGVPVRRALRIAYQQTSLAAAIARHKLDVFFATATVVPLLSNAPVVLAVQFLQFYQVPEAYGRFRTHYLRLMLPLSLKKAKQVIIFTDSAKCDLVKWTGVPKEKVRVVPHGLSHDIWQIASLPEAAPERQIGPSLTGGRPYIVYVSSTYGYKNHSRLIRAFGLLKQRAQLPHALLLVGSEVAISFAQLRKVAEQAGVASDVIFAGRLDQRAAAATYLSADLAAIPTLYETFGFPALEAMACGCLVVTSNMGSMAELAGDAAILVDPLAEHAITDGMERALSDAPLRQNLIALGKQRAQKYTWRKSAARTLAILEEVGLE